MYNKLVVDSNDWYFRDSYDTTENEYYQKSLIASIASRSIPVMVFGKALAKAQSQKMQSTGEMQWPTTFTNFSLNQKWTFELDRSVGNISNIPYLGIIPNTQMINFRNRRLQWIHEDTLEKSGSSY